ncbi:MAG: twin-arginine translocase TatA/TatE family subunit [Candidatus Hydrothermarchaeales archaeon]
MLGSSELVVILLIALLVFGPQKLPELARALGQAAGEYHKAAREFEEETKKFQTGITKEIKDLDTEPQVKESKKNSAEIRKIARSLGISTGNKDDTQLLKEIDKRVSRKKPISAKVEPETKVAKEVKAAN